MTSRARPVGSAISRAEPASGRRSAPPLLSTAARGGCWSRSGRSTGRRPTTPSSGWPGRRLLDTAIANADSRDQLTASRARVLAAGDDARRQVVRDLHDGAQQRLVHTIVTLKLAERALRNGPGDAGALLAEALTSAERATVEVRELAHGILPAVLTRGGLRAGVQAFLSRLDLPVDVDVPASGCRRTSRPARTSSSPRRSRMW
jgi:signal transduction histidine kinase